MALNKLIGSSLIVASILLITHSLVAIYVEQCLKSSVSFPRFFTKDIVDFFQLETSRYGMATRMVLILILPSLGAEIYMNKKKRFLTTQRILSVTIAMAITVLIYYILFYPFFEE